MQWTVALLFAMVIGRSAGIAPGTIGALACGLASAWAARRRTDTQLAWAAVAVSCVGWIVSAVAGRQGLGSTWVEAGFFVFAIGVTAGQLAWPELRGSTERLVATVVDVVAVLSTLALWTVGGLSLLKVIVPVQMAESTIRSADLVLPLVTAIVVAPQLATGRRRCVWGVALGIAFLFVGNLLPGLESTKLAGLFIAAPVLNALAFAVMLASIVSGQVSAPTADLLDHDRIRPPFLLPGLLGAAGLVMALLVVEGGTLFVPDFALLVGACLGAREVLRVRNRRHADERLAASLDLEGRLLTLQGNTSETVTPQETMNRSCSLAMEVLRTNAAFVWVVESDVLVLRALGPKPGLPEGLLGRRISITDPYALAARIVRTGASEACDAGSADSRVDRFLATLLDAGPLLGVPILGEEAPIGVFVLVRARGDRAFSHWDKQKAALIAAQIATTFRHLELHDELENQLREATLVHRFAVQAGTARSLNDVAWYLLESIRSRIPLDRGSVYLADSASRGSYTPIAYFPTRALERDQAGGPDHADLRVPLRTGDTLVGHIELRRREGGPFTPGETRIAETLGHQAAIALQNVRLQEESGKVSTYRELDRLKTDLLNAVSHDLRGPLANIKGYAATLVDSGSDMPPDEQRSFLETIEEEADRLRDLLNHLLDLSKIEAGVLKIEKNPLSVERLVQQTLSSVRSPDHQYDVRVPRELSILGDAKRLRQVLSNLLENAAKYSPDGGAISVRATATDAEVVISVADSGVGIPRHQWDRVFRPYQRADTATSRGISGNGLGLAICKGIVEAHGGRIWVESEPGEGSTFSFTVPRAAGDAIAGFDDQDAPQT
ncbi:MAG TPA: ATP-binding protein [Chloroflexota bacterium]|nr:ATP-binding protein [Chloroflexota bacterium]